MLEEKHANLIYIARGGIFCKSVFELIQIQENVCNLSFWRAGAILFFHRAHLMSKREMDLSANSIA